LLLRARHVGQVVDDNGEHSDTGRPNPINLRSRFGCDPVRATVNE